MEKEQVLDEVLVMLMRGPHSYTGEDTVEIDCHGGVLAVKRVLEAVLHAAKDRRSGRIYEACISQRKDRPVTGGSGDGMVPRKVNMRSRVL